MLIICHNNHIVRHSSLLLTIIKSRISGRNRIVYRKYNSLLPAAYRKLPDKLYIMRSCFCLNTLDVQVDSIHLISFYILHEGIDQSLAHGCPGKQNLWFYILPFIKIIYHPPYLKPHIMGFLNIALICQAFIIPVIIRQHKPCGSNDIYPFNLSHHLL